MTTIGPGHPYYAEPFDDPYPTPEPTPYQPDEWDEPQGPLDETPPTTEVLLTPEEAIANAEELVTAAAQSMPEPEPVDPPMVAAYKATLPEEPT